MKNFLLILLVFLFGMNKRASCQSTDWTGLSKQFENYRTSTLQEKLYAHTDRSLYLAGETIWFSLYTVDASFHKPLAISKVAYAEVINKDHTPVVQAKIVLENGKGSGHILLPQDLGSGTYIVRFYTNWMKNFDANYFFEKPLTVLNTVKELPIEMATDTLPKYDVQFFPEGGNLVDGLESIIACKATDQYGRGIEYSGVLINEMNDTVVHFQSALFGMSRFSFVPEKNHMYKAIVALSGKNKIVKQLPKIFESGYVLRVTEQDNNLLITVKATKAEDGKSLALFAHTRSQIVSVQQTAIKGSAAQFLISKEKLKDGITHLTLFDDNNHPLCERLYFKKPVKTLQIDAKLDEKTYATRRKISVDLRTKDEAGIEQDADLSMSVYRIDSIIPEDQETIAAYLYLNSDLKGFIESPSYYFTHTGPAVDNALDNLMLTQGWSRFKWENVIASKNDTLKYVPELEGHIVAAKVVDSITNQGVSNVKALLSIPGKSFSLYGSTSQVDGSVQFFTKGFFDIKELVAQLYTNRDSTLRIDIQTPFSENYSTRPFPYFNAAGYATEQLRSRSIRMQLQKAYEKPAAVKPVVEDTIPFYGTPLVSYLLDNYVRFPTMEEVLREYVREINVAKQQKKFVLSSIRRNPDGVADRRFPMMLLDGVPVLDDLDKIVLYDPLKIKSIDIVNTDFYLGPIITQGIANFKSYTGQPNAFNIDPKVTVLDYEGLQSKKEFYAPVYNTAAQQLSRLPDFRNLLFWSPRVRTENGKAQVSFYTSDLPGRYIVVMQALSDTGSAGSNQIMFDVTNSSFAQK